LARACTKSIGSVDAVFREKGINEALRNESNVGRARDCRESSVQSILSIR
jgi:hypothetical protein